MKILRFRNNIWEDAVLKNALKKYAGRGRAGDGPQVSAGTRSPSTREGPPRPCAPPCRFAALRAQRERSVKIKLKIKKTYFENKNNTILKIKDLAAKIK